VLAHRFRRPATFDLGRAWQGRKAAFVESIPRFGVTVRVAPAGERLLALLQEATPALPLAPDVKRDPEGWAVVDLSFERLESATRLLLQLGPCIEVLRPRVLRTRVARATREMAALYARA
jgi:predicted DNA-binding transcriptional regulator YafY